MKKYLRYRLNIGSLFDCLNFSFRIKKNLKSLNAKKINRLVFVCKGNVCRSPYAEVVAKSIGFPSISCGVEVSCSSPAELMAIRAAHLRGQDLSQHMSRSISDISLDSSDCLVAMDPENLSAIKNVVTRIGCQYTLIGIWRNPSQLKIKDPYGKNINEFVKCYSLIDEALTGLIKDLELNGLNISPNKLQ